jgi:hypothetical protein
MSTVDGWGSGGAHANTGGAAAAGMAGGGGSVAASAGLCDARLIKVGLLGRTLIGRAGIGGGGCEGNVPRGEPAIIVGAVAGSGGCPTLIDSSTPELVRSSTRAPIAISPRRK